MTGKEAIRKWRDGKMTTARLAQEIDVPLWVADHIRKLYNTIDKLEKEQENE